MIQVEQATLFDTPVAKTESAMLPPKPPAPPAVVAEPLGPCIKCGVDAVLKSPGGSIYCGKHGYCSRRTCLKSVEKFVLHPRLQIWVCSCILKYEENAMLVDAVVMRQSWEHGGLDDSRTV